MRYLFFIFALLTFIVPINEVVAGNTVSVNKGEAMKTLEWRINDSPSNCTAQTDYISGSNIQIRWSGLKPTIGSEDFSSMTVNADISSGNYRDFYFRCELVTDPSIFDTAYLRVCNNTTHRSDGASSCLPLPSAPTQPSATVGSCGTGAISISWGSVAGATGYDLRYKLTSGSTWTTLNNVTSARNVPGLSAGVSYDFQVLAKNSVGDSSWSPTRTATAPNACANAPTLGGPLTAPTPITQTGATVNVNITGDGGSPLISRGTCWGTTPNPTACVAEGGIGASPFNHSLPGLTCNTPYYYRGYARNASGFTGYSPDDTFTTSACVFPPPAPGAITVVPQACGTSQLKLDWADVAGATSYNVYNAMSNTLIANSNMSEYYYSGNPSTLYPFYVRARNASGVESTNSPSNFGTTPGACPLNQPPVASAGDDIYITLPQNTTSPIGASATDPDDGVASILWTPSGVQPATPTITNPNTISPTFSNLTVDGMYTFNVRVRDVGGLERNDTVNVYVDPAEVFSCGGLFPLFATYHPGDNTGLSNDTPNMYSVINDVPLPKCQYICNPGYYRDGPMCSLPDLEVMSGPLLGNPFTSGVDITFNGTVRNMRPFAIPQGGWADLEIDWYGDNLDIKNFNAFGGSKLGPMPPFPPVNLTYTIPAANIPAGNHRYRFHVDVAGEVPESNDGNPSNNQSNWTNFTVNPANVVPIANAGPDVTINLPTTDVNLDGGASVDPDSGMISTYLWTPVSRPAGAPPVTITSDFSAFTDIQNLTTVGNYVFRLRVTDMDGGFDEDEVTITVNADPNTAPIGSAGVDININLPQESTNPDGASASDPGGFVTSVLWTQVSKPSGAPDSFISNANTLSPTFDNLSFAGTYRFNLHVEDNGGLSLDDTVDVNVGAAAAYVCTGLPLPAFSSFYPGDDLPVVDTPISYETSDTPNKCEYRCNPAFVWVGGACVLPDLSVANIAPVAGTNFAVNADIKFDGVVNNSADAFISEGGWADLEIDTNGDAIADQNYNAYIGNTKLGNFSQSESKPLTMTISAGTLPAGSYLYRFHVDVAGEVSESNDGNPSNNQSNWVPFSVAVSAPNPPGTEGPTGTPANPYVTAIPGSCGGRIIMGWEPSAYADTYEISLTGGAPWTDVGNVTSYTIDGLTVNTAYNNIQVRARNSTDFSTGSDAPNVTSSNYCDELLVNGCTINDGASTCSGTVLPWDITGAAPATANITRLLPLPVSAILDPAGVIGGPIPVTLNYGLNRIAGRDGSLSIRERDLNITCQPNSFFHTAIGTCLPRPEINQVTLDPIVIRSGKTASIQYSIKADYDMVCSFSGGILAADIIHTAAAGFVTYPAVTTNILTAGQVVRISCNTRPNAYMTPPTTKDTRINVLPAVQEN